MIETSMKCFLFSSGANRAIDVLAEYRNTQAYDAPPNPQYLEVECKGERYT
jgi:hypothetical protein